MNGPRGWPLSRMVRAHFRMSARFRLRAGSNPAIARRSVKNIFCGSSPFGGERFFARLKTRFGGIPAPPPRAGSFSGSNAGALFSTLKENGFANHRFPPSEDNVSGETRLANMFFGKRKFLAPAGKAMRYPNAAATFRRFSPPNGSTRILNAPGTAREKDKINAGIAPFMRETLHSGAAAFKKNGEFACLTVKIEGGRFPLLLNGNDPHSPPALVGVYSRAVGVHFQPVVISGRRQLPV